MNSQNYDDERDTRYIISTTIQQSLEKIGIFIDLARLYVLTFYIKQDEIDALVKTKAQVLLLLAIICQVAWSIIYAVKFTTLDDFNFIIIMEWVQLAFNIAIFISYLCLFYSLNSHFTRVLRVCKAQMTVDEKWHINKNRLAYLILILAMCQMALLRLSLTVKSAVDRSLSENLIDNPYFYVCKTLMIMGFFVSLYMRIETAEHHGERITRIDLENFQTEPESMSILFNDNQ